MKIYLLSLICLALYINCPVLGQIVDFKGPSTFKRKPDATTQKVTLSASGITTPVSATVTVKSQGSANKSPNDVALSPDPQIHQLRTNVEIPILLVVSADTTEKNAWPYTLSVKYPLANGRIEETIRTITLAPYESEPDAPTIQRNDFLLFAGSNFDPANEGGTLNNFSFEGIFKYDLPGRFHMRIGGYSNRNFSVDSATALPQTRYINTTPNQPLVVGTSQIAIQTFSIDSRATTRSVGLYGDLFLALLNQKDTRISAAGHVEYVRRTIVPTISVVGSVVRDTVIFTQELANRNPVVSSRLTANDNIFVPRRNIDQYYFGVGVVIERATKVFDLFIEPFASFVITNTRLSSRPSVIQQRQVTLGVRGQATVKLLDVTLAIDLKDINTPRPFTNVSIGIPVSAKSLTDKLKKL